MHRNCKTYRDVKVAPGSQLYQALEDGDKQKAEQIYQQCEKDLVELEGRCLKCKQPWEQHDFGVPEPTCP
jgi:hypothetical protein